MFYNKESESHKRSRIKYFVFFVIIMSHQLIVSQSRQVVVYISVSLIAIIVFEQSRGFGAIKKLLMCISISIFLLVSDYLTKLIYSLSAPETAVSTQNRLYAFKYYYHYFIEHPIVGFGFANINVNRSIVRGTGAAFVDDVGLVGQMAKLGVFVVPMYVFPMLRSGHYLFKIRKEQNKNYYLLVVAFFVFMIVGSATFIVLNQQFILFYPIFLAICEYTCLCEKRLKSKKSERE